MMLLLLASVAIAAAVYLVAKAWKINQHWASLGVPYAKPILFFGNMFDMVVKKRTQGEILARIYADFPQEPVIGYYHFLSPRLLIRDLEIVERVFVKDFAHFMDRTHPIDIKANPLVVNLFALTGNKWRAIRHKFSPMFTAAKLRNMFPQVIDIADALMKLLDKKMQDIDVKDETGKFAMEVIGSCVFGIDTKTLDDSEGNEFRTEAQYAFRPALTDFARMTMFATFPKLARMLGLTFTPPRTNEYFGGIVRTALNHRKTTGFFRNDFVQMMVTLQEKGFIEVEKSDPGDDYLGIDQLDGDDSVIELTDDVMVGQSFVFLVAGFEATATTMAFMLMELAAHPEAQDKVREEVRKATKKGQDMTYDVLKDLRYLDSCLKETLRLHPPVGQLIRMCVKTYSIPGTDVTVNPGDFVMVPSLGIHMDPGIYPDPDEFLPERWDVVQNAKRPPCTYLPFGDGPRICIGMRFATMEMKCCISKILLKYKINPHPKTVRPVKINPHSFFGTPIKPILCNLEKLD